MFSLLESIFLNYMGEPTPKGVSSSSHGLEVPVLGSSMGNTSPPGWKISGTNRVAVGSRDPAHEEGVLACVGLMTRQDGAGSASETPWFL